MASQSVLVGVGGWEHESLNTCLYGAETEYSTLKLRYYSRFFDVVEIRSTFWDDDLDAETAKQWIEAVAENKRFRFVVKLHRSFSHEKKLNSESATRIRGMLHELQKNDRLGALLVQLPYAFTNTSANRFFLNKLGEIFRGFPVHAEFRHESWNQPNLMAFLNESILAPVNSDLPRTAQLMPFVTGVVGNTVYVRLHGRNERGWLTREMDARYDYLYNAREMREIKRRIEILTAKCSPASNTRVMILFNNTSNGKAVANAFHMISSLMEGKQITVPEATMLAFPDSMNNLNAVVDDGLFSRFKTYGKVG